MEIKIKCPDCGKLLKITVEPEESKMVEFKTTKKSESSWSEIAERKSSLQVGDEVSCVLKDGRKVTFVVAALNPYGDNQVAFVTKDCVGKHRMNESATNEGGWKDCEMRKYLNEELFSLLPDELQGLIAPRKMKAKSEPVETVDNLWLLSLTEVFGEDGEEQTEDVHFPLFEKGRDRVKCDEYGDATFWWLRSPNTANSHNFWYVYANGHYNNYYYFYAYTSSGVAFGFLI